MRMNEVSMTGIDDVTKDATALVRAAIDAAEDLIGKRYADLDERVHGNRFTKHGNMLANPILCTKENILKVAELILLAQRKP